MKVNVFVLVPPDSADFSQAVDQLMAPFSCELEVEPYQTECWCIQARAQSEVSDRVLARLGTVPEVEARVAHLGLTEAQEARFHVLLEKESVLNEAEKEELAQLREIVVRPMMEAHFIWDSEERKEWGENPPELRPQPDCPDCAGSGIMTETVNPNSHYDYYLIFSDLEVPQYNPELDVNLRLPCANSPDKSCALEEQPEEVSLRNFLSLPARTSRAVRAALRVASPASCEGCLGYAERLRWAKDWKESRQSMLPVSWVDECQLFPYAVVTPDGKWHDLDVSPFGWDEATIERMWKESVATFERLLEENAECYIAACKIHI